MQAEGGEGESVGKRFAIIQRLRSNAAEPLTVEEHG